jgi:1-acyl-sn-glycerol-3-phosphate acyltransferase
LEISKIYATMATQTMSPERKPDTNDAVKQHKGFAESLLNILPRGLKGRLLRSGMERVLYTTKVEFPPDFRENVIAALLKGPIVITHNHKSDADILAADMVAAYIVQIAAEEKIIPENRKTKGYVEPFALSLETGGQGEMSTDYEDSKPLLKKLNVEPIPTPTPNDKKSERVTPEQIKEWETKAMLRMGLAVIKRHKSIIIAPEASVQGGRINPETNQIYGMQPFVPEALCGTLQLAARPTGYATLLLVGVSDGEKVQNPQNNKITPLATKVGLGLRFDSIMTVHIGAMLGFTSEQLKNIDDAELNLTAGKGIAKLLKPEEQGVYAEAA